MTNRALLLPYLAPYVAYVGVASVPLPREWSYALRIALTLPLLLWAMRRHVPLRGPRAPSLSAAAGVAAGLAGTALWVALVRPFAAGEAEPWEPLAFGLRLAAAGLLVPLFEEQLLRGYVLRLVRQWEEARSFDEAFERRSIRDFAPGAASALSVAASTVLFALGHRAPEIPAALAYGLLMAGLWVARKDLLSCVVAHATTNVALAFYVRGTGSWALW